LSTNIASTLPSTIALSPQSFISSVCILTITIDHCRLRLFRHDLDFRVVHLSIHSILLDAHDSPSCGLPSPFHRQLHLRRPNLVLSTCLSSHYKRHIRLYMWNDLGTNSSNPIIPQKDCRGVHRRMDFHNHNWRGNSLHPHQIQIHDLSCHCTTPIILFRLHLTLTGSWSLSMVWIRLRPESCVHPTRIPGPSIVHSLLWQNIPYSRLNNRRTNSIPHPCSRNICLSHRPLRRLFRLGFETSFQDKGFRT